MPARGGCSARPPEKETARRRGRRQNAGRVGLRPPPTHLYRLLARQNVRSEWGPAHDLTIDCWAGTESGARGGHERAPAPQRRALAFWTPPIALQSRSIASERITACSQSDELSEHGAFLSRCIWMVIQASRGRISCKEGRKTRFCPADFFAPCSVRVAFHSSETRSTHFSS